MVPMAAGHLLSVEESRLARRPPLKAGESTIGTGLNSSEREDIQTMDSRFFGLLFCGAMERKTLPVICVLLRASGKTVPC
jgi:hypothetical protein